VRRERAREQASGIVAYSADEGCRTVVFALDGRLWVLRAGEDPDQPPAVPELQLAFLRRCLGAESSRRDPEGAA
jgi:hypothetical protein